MRVAELSIDDQGETQSVGELSIRPQGEDKGEDYGQDSEMVQGDNSPAFEENRTEEIQSMGGMSKDI